jgi:hypothetical protein
MRARIVENDTIVWPELVAFAGNVWDETTILNGRN